MALSSRVLSVAGRVRGVAARHAAVTRVATCVPPVACRHPLGSKPHRAALQHDRATHTRPAFRTSAAPPVVPPRRSFAASSFHGVDISGSQEAVTLYDQTVSEYLALAGTPYDHLVKAVEIDPEFVMGHATMGLFQLLSNVPPSSSDVQDCIAKAEALVVDKGLGNARERAYVAAARAWRAEDIRGATAHLESTLLDNPFDSLTLRLLHDTYFMLGDKYNLRHSIGRVVPRWTPDVPEYPRILGMYAFGLEESGQYPEAEDFAMRTLHMDPTDTWATHTALHVFEMNGRRNEGLRTLREFRDYWEEAQMLYCHMQWHWGLFQLDDGDMDMAFSRYDVELRGGDSPFMNNLCDAIGLLWRMELYGANVQDRWTKILDMVKVYMHDHAFAFNDMFIAMALAGAGDSAASQAHLESMRAYASGVPDSAFADLAAVTSYAPTAVQYGAHPWRGLGGHDDAKRDNRAVTAAVGVQMCEGILAYRNGDYDTAVDKLLPIRPLIELVGGSDAQRDVMELTTLQAVIQSGRTELAVALLSERTSRRTAQPVVWAWYADALEALGDSEGAAGARDKSYSLGLNQGGQGAQ